MAVAILAIFCLFVWQHAGFVVAILTAGLFGIIYKLGEITKRMDERR